LEKKKIFLRVQRINVLKEKKTVSQRESCVKADGSWTDKLIFFRKSSEQEKTGELRARRIDYQL